MELNKVSWKILTLTFLTWLVKPNGQSWMGGHMYKDFHFFSCKLKKESTFPTWFEPVHKAPCMCLVMLVAHWLHSTDKGRNHPEVEQHHSKFSQCAFSSRAELGQSTEESSCCLDRGLSICSYQLRTTKVNNHEHFRCFC